MYIKMKRRGNIEICKGNNCNRIIIFTFEFISYFFFFYFRSFRVECNCAFPSNVYRKQNYKRYANFIDNYGYEFIIALINSYVRI